MAQPTGGGIVDSTNQFTLLTYGLPDLYRQNARNVIAEKWGIRFYTAAGCTISEALRDSVKNHNNLANQNITAKYGENWSEKFKTEVDAEFDIQMEIIETLSRLDFIQKTNKELEQEGDALLYQMKPVAHSDNYEVWIKGWGKTNKTGESVMMIYYKIKFDSKTKKYKVLSNKMIPAK